MPHPKVWINNVMHIIISMHSDTWNTYINNKYSNKHPTIATTAIYLELAITNVSIRSLNLTTNQYKQFHSNHELLLDYTPIEEKKLYKKNCGTFIQ